MPLIEGWAHANRLRHRHPAEQAAFAGGMLLLSLTLPPVPGALLILAVMTGATTVWAGVPVVVYLRVLAVPAGFLAGGAAAMMVSLSPGPGGWHLTPAPAATAAPLLRALAAAASLGFFALTTPVGAWVAPLARRRATRPLAELLLLTYRFLHLLAGTAAAMRVAQAARLGYATPARAYRSLALLAAALLPRALERARRLERGLAARGYEGELRVLPRARRLSARRLAGLAALQLAVAIGGSWPWPR